MGVLRRLTDYALRYKLQIAIVYSCLIGATLLSLAIPKLLGLAIDSALGSGDKSDLVWMAVLVLAVSLLRGGFAYGQSYVSELTSQRVAYAIRHDFLARLQYLGFAFHDRQKTGDLMSRATSDVESIRWFVSFGLIYSMNIVVLVVGASVLLLLIDWQLALISLAAIPVTVYIAVRIRRRFRDLWSSVQVETGRMTTVLQENLSGMRVVKSFGGEEYEKHKFGEAAKIVAEETFTVNRLHAANSSLLSLLFTLVIALVIWVGGSRIIDSPGLTAGELTQFVLYLGLLLFPIRMSGWVVNIFTRAAAAGDRIFQVLDAKSPVEEKHAALSLGRARGHVKFDSVSFRYLASVSADGHDSNLEVAPMDGEILHHVTLEARPGQKIALLGPPGSGKSTLVNLIHRCYDVTGGNITIDGIDVRDASLESLRRNVGIVFQDVFLFMASIRENISYGFPDASLEQVQAAARSAQIHDFIMGLPDQYDTLVGERGITLSGGQKQRVSIARTLLLDPPILVLDDSTSSVDVATEFQIRRALAEVMKDRTTFIIAHRVSSVKSADRILVLEDGRVAEMGTHQELISRQGLYKEIYQLQLSVEEDVLAEHLPGGESGDPTWEPGERHERVQRGDTGHAGT